MQFWLMACSAIMTVLVLPNYVKKLVFMCELYNITELPDIKRVIVNTNAIEPQAHMALHDIDAAIESFKNVLVLKPNDAGIKKDLVAARKKVVSNTHSRSQL